MVGKYGGTTWEDPEYPGILSIQDTVYVLGIYRGGGELERL